jgi:2-polyprenyl-6-hydroxyphenyl methylase/3-demethylubiquinone-9 3-methyltransferase
MKSTESIDGYRWKNASPTCAHNYLLPALEKLVSRLEQKGIELRAFDLGCGNGAIANWLASRGWEVVGVDASTEGIAQANKHYPELRLEQGSAYDDLAMRYGQFPLVLSLEVVEHVYAPRDYAKTLFALVQPGGHAIISTPYHGYLKNLALALTGKMDKHFTALWDHGHIKFWSIKTLKILLSEQGFMDISIHRVGRIPPLAKSMIAAISKNIHS